MARALALALVLTLSAVGLKVGGSQEVSAVVGDISGEDGELDDENDSSPFTIVVVHPHGLRCGGSLVSQRTALTSAWCARGRGQVAARGLLALAASAGTSPPGSRARRASARRIARLVFATGADAEENALRERHESVRSWAGAMADIALAELESPFGAEAHTRPILMATEAAQCGAPDECHVARVLPGGVLRIVNATLQHARRCTAAAAHWVGLQEQALCLTGPELCQSDWGAGVVCGGKLCGVLSTSLSDGLSPGAPGTSATAGGAGAGCGDTHAAHSVPRWRRFVQCAHTAHSCKRRVDCKNICNERGLLEEEQETEERSPDSAETTSQSMNTPTLTVARRSGECLRVLDGHLRSAQDLLTEPCPAPEADPSEPRTRLPHGSLHSSESHSLSDLHAPLKPQLPYESRQPPAATTLPWHPEWPTSHPTSKRRKLSSKSKRTSTSSPAFLVTHTNGAAFREEFEVDRPKSRVASTTSKPPARSRTPVKALAVRPRTVTRTRTAARPTRSSRTPHSSTNTTRTPPMPQDIQPGEQKIVSRREFEPNRPDFKAGEYGDNAADYSDDERGAADGSDGADVTGGEQATSTSTAQATVSRKRLESAESIELSDTPELSPAERRVPPPPLQPHQDPPISKSAAHLSQPHLLQYTVLFLYRPIYT